MRWVSLWERWTAVACVAWSLAVVACTEPEASGPPELNPGRDICAECGMSIVEPEFAAAALHGESGSRAHVAFDDIGCLLVWQAERSSEAATMERWVMGYDSRAWVPFMQAHFVVGGATHTPMDSKIVAFASKDAAAREQSSNGGAVATAAELTIPDNMISED